MEMNAWWVAKELAYRIDGAPVFCEYIHCSVTENPSDAFFFNNEYLKHFQKATEGIRKETPGYFYIMKIMKFMEEHYRVGDLYMEYIKDGCKEINGEQCSWCRTTGWKGPVTFRIPEPMTDKENPGHYKDVFDTPNSIEDSDKPRPIDELSPRGNLKKLFAEDKISLKNEKAIEEFSKQYIAEEEPIISNVQHMEELKVNAQIRVRERQNKKNERNQKSFCDYNWPEVEKNGRLNSLTKPELQHYLKKYKLSYQGKKSDWIERIATHMTLHGIVSNQSAAPTTSANISKASNNPGNDFSSDDSDSDEDEALAVGAGSDEDNIEDQEQDFYISDHTTTRSGRVAGRLSVISLHQ